MRDPKRIPIVLEMIRKIWLKHSDLRLTQLIGNCFPPGDNYHKEDDELVERLKFVYRELDL